MSITSKACIAFEFLMLAVAFVLVVLRVYVRAWLQDKFTSADFFVILAWCIFAANNALDALDWKLGMLEPNIPVGYSGAPDFNHFIEDEKVIIKGLKAFFASGILNFSSMYVVKFAFISIYYNLIPLQLYRLRLALNITTFFTISGFLTMVAVNLFYCQPIQSNWNPAGTACWAIFSPIPYTVSVLIQVVTDLMIYILPFFLIPILRGPKRNGGERRPFWGLVAIFSLGFVSIATTVGRAAANGVGVSMPTNILLAAAEQLAAILVACSPPLKWLWKSFRFAMMSVNGDQERGNSGSGTRSSTTGGRRTIDLKTKDSAEEGGNARVIMISMDDDITSKRANGTSESAVDKPAPAVSTNEREDMIR